MLKLNTVKEMLKAYEEGYAIYQAGYILKSGYYLCSGSESPTKIVTLLQSFIDDFNLYPTWKVGK